MPNWCTNSICIQFNTNEARDKFLDKVNTKDSGFDFHKIKEPDYAKHPEPNGLGVVNAQVEAWGTKWVPSDIKKEDWVLNDKSADLYVDTAWSPPEKVLLEIYDQDKNVESISNNYYEMGNGFIGSMTIKGNKAIDCYVDVNDDLNHLNVSQVTFDNREELSEREVEEIEQTNKQEINRLTKEITSYCVLEEPEE